MYAIKHDEETLPNNFNKIYKNVRRTCLSRKFQFDPQPRLCIDFLDLVT